MWRGYFSAYERAGEADRASVDRWLPVMAAARLAENIPEERRRLLELATSG
jgi:hypothetical protein